MKISFLASQPHYLDHIAPVWRTLPKTNRGTLYIPEDMTLHANKLSVRDGHLLVYSRQNTILPGEEPVLVASYGDLLMAKKMNLQRKVLYMEHGTGHTFHSSAYPDGPGKRDWADLFLAPNEYTKKKIKVARSTRCEVIGTPKTDWIIEAINPRKELKKSFDIPATVAIGFHWGSRSNNPPESGSAFDHYKNIIPDLKREFNLLGYGHPLASKVYKPFFESLGIPYEENLMRVFVKADILINDLSSAMYEFLVTGKPVVVLNAPWFRREIEHGIRFWDYSDIGANVWEPRELSEAIQKTFINYQVTHGEQRLQALTDLYPYLGCSAERAVEVILNYLEAL